MLLKTQNNWFVKAFVKRDLREHRLKKHSKFTNNKDVVTKYKNYFITLTAGGEPKEYVEALKRILTYKKFKVKYGYGVIELTKNGEPHAHIYIESEDYIRSERIARIWKRSFFQIKRVYKDNGIRNYCEKDSNNTELLSFCKKNKIPRVINLGDL